MKSWSVGFTLILILAPPTSSLARSNDYGLGQNWICRPERNDACKADLSTSMVAADGSVTLEKWKENPSPPIDCFYIYPTVSRQKTANANMRVSEFEKITVREQLARFGSLCRLFAPLYRQTTVTTILAAVAGKPMKGDRELAYHDVLDAWNHYLKYDNRDRGVVLIGHSQGTAHLTRLIKEEIESEPVKKRIVSAFLIGGEILVPKGKDVGGTFQRMPLCRSSTQTGCIIAYGTYLKDVPPPVEGVATESSLVNACTNPASLSGGSGELKAYLPAAEEFSLGKGFIRFPDGFPAKKRVKTPFVGLPRMLRAECVERPDGAYLSVSIHPEKIDLRTKGMPGETIISGKIRPERGLHMVDVDLALGNLLEIVAQQTKSYGK